MHDATFTRTVESYRLNLRGHRNSAPSVTFSESIYHYFPTDRILTMLKLTTILPLLAFFRSTFGQDRSIKWLIPSDLQPFDSITMYAKDTLTFVYTGNHDVYIHPTGNCNQDDRIFVGAQLAGSASYTFKDSEIDTNVTFVCDYLNHCTFGLTINVLVLEQPPSTAPSQVPSLSFAPSKSLVPTITSAPSDTPSTAPSSEPSDLPPPSTAPSQVPSVSFAPSTVPPRCLTFWIVTLTCLPAF
jgi:hypothetical protein